MKNYQKFWCIAACTTILLAYAGATGLYYIWHISQLAAAITVALIFIAVLLVLSNLGVERRVEK